MPMEFTDLIPSPLQEAVSFIEGAMDYGILNYMKIPCEGGDCCKIQDVL